MQTASVNYVDQIDSRHEILTEATVLGEGKILYISVFFQEKVIT